MYNILICDADSMYIKKLSQMLLESNDDKRKVKIRSFSSGEELLEKFPKNVDILILDVVLGDEGGMDGNKLAMEVRRRDFQGVLVMCSGVFQPTPETIVVSPYRYLMKNDSEEKTMGVLREIWKEADRRKMCALLEGSYQREKILIKTKDIIYFTRYRRGSEVHLETARMKKYPDGAITVPLTLDELSEVLHLANFAMPHNGYLINLRYVEDLNLSENRVLVESGDLPISRSKKAEFVKAFERYTAKEYEPEIFRVLLNYSPKHF